MTSHPNTSSSYPVLFMWFAVFSITIAHGFRLLFFTSKSTASVLFRDIGPFILSLVVLAGIYWLYKQRLQKGFQLRVLAWFLAGLSIMSVIGLLIGISEGSDTAFTALSPTLILNSATTGAGIGFIIGVYDLRGKRRDSALLLLHNVTQELLEADSKKKACLISVDAAHSIIQLPLAGIWLEKNGRLEPVAVSNIADNVFGELPTLEQGDSLAWEVFEVQQPKTFNDLSNNPHTHNSETEIKSEYIVPIGKHGVMISGSFSDRQFSSLERELAKLLAVHTELVLDRIERTVNLERREKELEKQNNKLDRFASLVSHDLRNPINVIDGYLDIARETNAEEDFDEIQAAVDRMDTLVTDLLALSQSGDSIQDTGPVSLKAVAENASNNVQLEGIAVIIDQDPVMVIGDDSRLKQLFENLFKNTVEHAETADMIRVDFLENGFTVEDNGEGIPVAEQDSIFEYGYTNSKNGTGLGLAIVREVVDGHGWDISVTNSSGSGARFEVRIPEDDIIEGRPIKE
ncbi:hypothetical protein CP556_14880 [Natrinema sp. CBA1119]|uniref:GAF domain-containing sensor histidine kinase n=1 Tax=Natrinema sp. CBA1119 TaxID=1608465 RepID=UPI000BF7AB83|nr:GAF domain-containing sensor histidine kinase [Natrinema sp. CBA1119]PGF17255.1 hypothetical protein CP556_14880 [Natrinema sp. CBA1119]